VRGSCIGHEKSDSAPHRLTLSLHKRTPKSSFSKLTCSREYVRLPLAKSVALPACRGTNPALATNSLDFSQSNRMNILSLPSNSDTRAQDEATSERDHAGERGFGFVRLVLWILLIPVVYVLSVGPMARRYWPLVPSRPVPELCNPIFKLAGRGQTLGQLFGWYLFRVWRAKAET